MHSLGRMTVDCPCLSLLKQHRSKPVVLPLKPICQVPSPRGRNLELPEGHLVLGGYDGQSDLINPLHIFICELSTQLKQYSCFLIDEARSGPLPMPKEQPW
jgi:hypothetical protein